DYTPKMPAGAKGWINPALDALFEPAPLSGIEEDHRVLAVLNGKRLIRLARLMFASFEDIEIERTGDHGGRLDPAFRVGDYPHEWHLDEVKLAHLLALAGAMGPDPRRLAAVIAEHIGIAPEMTLDRLKNVLVKTEWRRDSEGL